MDFPNTLAVYSASLYLSPGIVTSKSSTTVPSLAHSTLSNNYLSILNGDGTIPDATPLCTGLSNTLTVTTQLITPLSDVVIHN